VTMQPERFPFLARGSHAGPLDLLPYLPLVLSSGKNAASVLGLVDSGATINVLPHQVGLDLGASWAQQTLRVPLAGNLAGCEARGLLLTAVIGKFAPVQLAFAWVMTDDVPVILGQTNFFQQFHVCFYRAHGFFDVWPSTAPPPP
jgi:hypothetical protein